MSATGRNLAGNERRADDFYATPAWCTRAILPFVLAKGAHLSVLDPCCGDGAILDAVKAYDPGADTRGIELDTGRAATSRDKGHEVVCGDAMHAAWPGHTVLVTNPPFSLAAEFIARALANRLPYGTVAFLLRLNYLGSQKRAAFHRENPSDVYVLPRRPSFTGGGTDSIEYAWFVWGPGCGGRWVILNVEASR